MQIRIGNKQDESSIRELVADYLTELGLKLDLAGKDHDLQNVEKSYFGAHGACFVADQNKQIIAIACARRKSETALEIHRLIVHKAWRKQGIGRKLMKVLFNFATQMDYRVISIQTSMPCSPLLPFLHSCGFTQESSEKEAGALSLHIP